MLNQLFGHYLIEKGVITYEDYKKAMAAQSEAHVRLGTIAVLEGFLTEEEADIYRRGRNAKSPTMAKNATMSDYRKATGFEALMGYLYLKDEFERIVELVKKGIEIMQLHI